MESDLLVDCGFPGGNILLDRIEGNVVYVHQDLRDTDGDWFYWYFRIRGAAGRSLKIQFTSSQAIGVRGPAVSQDQGRTWSWLGSETIRENAFSFHFPPDCAEIRFSFGMPYQEDNLARFLGGYPGHPSLRKDELCLSRHGRRVELLSAGQLDQKARFSVLLTSRHHCCEMMTSYCLEGMISGILEETQMGAWLRKNVAFLIVPFVDKDGVEEGDQGKNRRPHDHNRDYVGRSIYPEVSTIRKLTPAWCDNHLDIALDLHCPWINGFLNEFPYFVGGPDQSIWNETQCLSRTLAGIHLGPIPFYTENNLPYGLAWNTGSEPGRKSASEWAADTFPGIRVGSSLEFPYANALGVEVNPRSSRMFGGDLIRAIACYLQAL